jgi:hypothetical protein
LIKTINIPIKFKIVILLSYDIRSSSSQRVCAESFMEEEDQTEAKEETEQ